MLFLGDYMKIAILGESKRFDYIAKKFEDEGNDVTYCKTSLLLPDYFEHELIILPIPTINKEGFINFKDGSQISPSSLLKKTNSSALIVGCNFTDDNYNVVDINKREDFAYLNAIPTAEAAIILAIKHLGATAYNAKCLICGFGRIGKMLSLRLKSLNAKVSVCARNPKDLAYIKALALNPIKISELGNCLSDYDVVFQTVPSEILNSEILGIQTKKPLIIELSSGCKGTDMKMAHSLGYKAVDATNLPERYTPNTAGGILYDVIMKILDENQQDKGGL